MSPSNKITKQNAQWQEKFWEIRKLANILQWHNNDPHSNNLDGEEVLPEACKFRKIKEKICIASIEQLKVRKITLSTEEYKQLVKHIKNTFTNEIDQKMETIHFEHLDVEDRLLSCMRAEQSGPQLRRVIDLRRKNAIQTVYTRQNYKPKRPT